MPDRYAAAVLARRAELRAPAHPDPRAALGAVRRAVAVEAAARFDALRAELGPHLARGDAARLPAEAVAAVRAVEDAAHARWWERARPVARRVAAASGLTVPAGWPPPIPVAAPVAEEAPEPVRLGEVLADPGPWRLAVLPLAVAPLLGLAGPALLVPGLGGGLLVLCLALGARRAAVRRARLRAWCRELLAVSRVRLAAELDRRARALDDEVAVALARHRAACDAELAALAPPRTPGSADAS